MVTNALAVLAFLLVGAATSRLVGPTSRYLLGLGVVGSVLHVTMLLRVPPSIALAVLIAASVLVVVLRRAPYEPLPPATNLPATLLALMPSAVLLFITAILPLTDYDGRVFWMLKAKAIAHERQIDGPFFRGEVMLSPRNEYPLLMPLDAAAVMMVAGDLDDRHVRWLFVVALAALALHARRWVGAWIAALIAWIPQFAVDPEGSALSTYSDLPLAAFAACAFFELLSGTSALRFGLWIAFMALTKNEGLVFALILLIPALIRFRRQVTHVVIPFGLATAALLLWRSRIAEGDGSETFLANLTHLPELVGRVPVALAGYAQSALHFQSWGLFWPAVTVATAILIWRREWRRLVLPLYAIATLSAVYVAIYAVTADWFMPDLIESSADRLLMHLIGPAIVILGFATRSSTTDEAGRGALAAR